MSEDPILFRDIIHMMFNAREDKAAMLEIAHYVDEHKGEYPPIERLTLMAAINGYLQSIEE